MEDDGLGKGYKKRIENVQREMLSVCSSMLSSDSEEKKMECVISFWKVMLHLKKNVDHYCFRNNMIDQKN